VALLAGGLTAATGGAAQARALRCGEVITANTKLTSDLVNCPDTGIVIGADNITLDLNGHVIDGDGIPPASCPPATLCDVGVDNSTGHSHVTITGGTIRQFDLGVGVAGGSGAAAADHIHHLAVAHTTSVGIVAIDTTRTVIDHNVIRDPGTSAVVVLGSAQARVASNVASGATGYAMFLPDGRHNLIVHNRLTASEHGFAVGGDRNVVRGNVVTRSGGSIDILDGARSTRVEHNRLSRVGDGIGVGIASGAVIEHNVVNRTGGARPRRLRHRPGRLGRQHRRPQHHSRQRPGFGHRHPPFQRRPPAPKQPHHRQRRDQHHHRRHPGGPRRGRHRAGGQPGHPQRR
jgi:hypothetical protein